MLNSSFSLPPEVVEDSNVELFRLCNAEVELYLLLSISDVPGSDRLVILLLLLRVDELKHDFNVVTVDLLRRMGVLAAHAENGLDASSTSNNFDISSCACCELLL